MCEYNKKGNNHTQWFFESGPISGYNAHPEVSSLGIYPAQVNNSGIYSCYGLKGKGKKHFVAHAQLKVFGMLSLERNTQSHIFIYL